jgi:signal transduction histidine kinase/AmiR/NasT family two-component response regulator
MTERFKLGLSFQTRVAAAAMATAVGVLLVACALFTLEQWSEERAALIQGQRHAADVLAPRLAEAIQANEGVRLARILKGLEIYPTVLDAALLDSRSQTIARYIPSDGARRSNGHVLESRTPVVGHGRRLGVLILHGDLEAVGSFLPRYLAMAGALFFAATALSLFLGKLLARRVTEPVRRLSEVMGEVAVSGDLRRRVERVQDDEFGRLIESFNALLDRLHANDQELRDTMQALVVARDDAEAANVQKSQFLANVSHEIRTPLNGVLAMAQVMAIGDLTDQQRERVDVIRGSGEALLTILNDILDVSKIEAGKLELEIVEFDFDSLVRAAMGGFEAVAQSKGVELALEMEPAATGPRLGDSARFRQILSNLVSNAVKFTERGSVRVRIEGVGPDGADGLRLAVSDTGIGIPEEKLPLLFQKFTQLDASTTRRFGGTGLGLSICQELTAKMDGAIWAESRPGEGTTFYVELPLPRAIAADNASDDQALPEDQGRPLRILAAEDNPTNQVVLSTILDIFGAEVQIVENGRLVVEAWANGEHDVILMDIQMPEMDGITATREIRKAEADSGRIRTPIIALSANAMAHQVKEYMEAGMDGHVSKPIELGKLHTALESALAARQASEAMAA